ncbi:MAG: hypothetical protein E6713_00525 [Sporomusaceae bacterium]|nr:hypothetical protein [Sporomusaceae bacterium]
MQRITIMVLLAALWIVPSLGSAMQLSSPVLLGGFAGKLQETPFNMRFSSVDDQFCDFGQDQDHVIRVYGQKTAFGRTAYTQIGLANKSSVRYPFWGDKIYEVKTDIGIRIYVTIAQGSDGVCGVDIFGIDRTGNFVKYLNWKDLKNYRWNEFYGSIGTRVQVFLQGDTILLKCGSGTSTWKYILKWDDNAQWFGIDYAEE